MAVDPAEYNPIRIAYEQSRLLEHRRRKSRSSKRSTSDVNPAVTPDRRDRSPRTAVGGILYRGDLQGNDLLGTRLTSTASTYQVQV